MAPIQQHRVATGVRRSSAWKAVQRQQVEPTTYPANSPSLIGAIHDVGYYQGLLANQDSFAQQSELEVLELLNGRFISRSLIGDPQCQNYFKSTRQTASSSEPSLRVLFCSIERAKNASYSCRLSLKASTLLGLLDEFQVSPQYLRSLLGEPDYWAPGDFAIKDANGDVTRIEFFNQQPRWRIHTADMPWSTYMTHDLTSKDTTYVVVCDKGHSTRATVIDRLTTMMQSAHPTDPFVVHTLIVHETFHDAREVITPLRYALYDALDRVDVYAQKPAYERGKSELEQLTIKLHVSSQEIDSMTAAAEMTAMIVRRLVGAHTRYAACLIGSDSANAVTKTADSLQWLMESVESQKRWLLSYKSRKDIAMNLVFNLVTQQDAVTSTTIAREAVADGASMKVIAALTMVFLPGTFLSSVFGMTFLDAQVKWWLYVALTIPLTCIVIGTWWLWLNMPRYAQHLKVKLRLIGSNSTEESGENV